jgi:hypothetical protein
LIILEQLRVNDYKNWLTKVWKKGLVRQFLVVYIGLEFGGELSFLIELVKQCRSFQTSFELVYLSQIFKLCQRRVWF